MNDKIKEYLNTEVFYLGLVYRVADCVVEVSGDNYKRIPVVFSLNNFEIKEDSLVNRNKIEFNCAKSNWGDFKDISRIFSIARANDMEIEFNKSKCGGFQIVSDIGKEKVELNSKDILGVESSEQVTIGEFKNFLDLFDLDEDMPIKLTFYNHSGSISESGLLQGVSVSQNGTLELITMR